MTLRGLFFCCELTSVVADRRSFLFLLFQHDITPAQRIRARVRVFARACADSVGRRVVVGFCTSLCNNDY